MTRTTTLTARSPEDLLALVPIVLGFVPRESVVMLTFGAQRTFHARVDLPVREAEVAEVVQALLEPARRHLRAPGGLRPVRRRRPRGQDGRRGRWSARSRRRAWR